MLHHGDMLEVLPTLPVDSLDACVTDPPYHLTSIVKRFGGENAAPAQFGRDGAFARASAGFMGKQWDGGDIAARPETWARIWRVLKPGAHLVAFGGTRTYHRMACAIEDAGFEIRDCLMWIYGSGFPKSHDVSKGIDKAAGSERKVLPIGNPVKRIIPGADQNKQGWGKVNGRTYQPGLRLPVTEAAQQWEGWGTALKPACEPIVLARKPLSERTVAANVMRWGTGALNIDGCRIGTSGGTAGSDYAKTGLFGMGGKANIQSIDAGRWPANVVHDGSEEVVAGFPETGSGTLTPDMDIKLSSDWSGGSYPDRVKSCFHANSGSAARFFYTAKADADDRIGSKHPTVKPLDLLQWLIRLVTPPGGTVLDPFAGTGTTGEAAWREGMAATLIEREAEHCEDIRRRIVVLSEGSAGRKREIARQLGINPLADLPLFGDLPET